ncbi:hypothetical protein FVEN_g3411 [Fusarium venenatum]|uniref:Mid2 domain-containing protein n=1 Tax=Fusarium venenatum TaxID=56646 RepID=A0A2L2TWJ7_9HYPO|nr:uncharacterized protein FVRRES_01427 [Fusarium venenatum]KAG8358881.1 hypothetical protein FVEN_g3411 [Fusarium venenatum]CEI64915.1 unnamed protein product [Fusarium venenatum]
MRSVTQPLLLLAAAALCSAGPLPRDSLHDAGYSYLMRRDCDSYCGSDNQYCCGSGETCETSDGVAKCVAAKGGWVGDYTTTWTETRTYTSTLMTRWEPAPEPTKGVDCVPKNDEQEQCGEICCAGWQTCAYKGQCSAKPGYDAPTAVVITSDGKLTTQYSAPYRVTGTTTIVNSGAPTESESGTATETDAEATATETSDEAAAGESGTGGGGLSAGAIAGIIIGVIAGVALLLLLCFCCIARGLWVALFGKKDKDKESRERVDVYEERYSRHGSRPPASASAHSRRPRHKGWFGFGGKKGGSPSSAGDRREKKSDGKKWLGIAGLAATLLALLNLKKDKRPASTKPARSSRGSSRSRYSDSYYSYSDYTSPTGSSSSGGRTNRTRRTARDSRAGSRARSHYSRDSRR